MTTSSMPADNGKTAVDPGAPSSAKRSAKRRRAPYRQAAFNGTAAGSGKTVPGGEARQRAAVILEVLAGVQTPASAAQALGIRLPRYYLMEQRALAGLVSACEPRPKGRTMTSGRQIARLERELAVCRRELGRQQALARAAQRVLGLKVAGTPPAPGNGKTAGSRPGAQAGKKSRRRRPVVRALRAARVLRSSSAPIHPVVGEVQTPAEDAQLAGGGNCQASTDAASSAQQGEQGG